MTTFQYRGKNDLGQVVQGLVNAESPRSAREKIRQEGVRLESMQSYRSAKPWSVLERLRRQRYSSALSSFLRDLATLLQAGVPLLEAMDSSLEHAPKSMQPVLLSMRDAVASGKSLADAMEAERWLFDEMIIGMVRVGENTGNLDEVLALVCQFREEASEVRDRVLGAILYPLIVLTVSVGVTIFLMTFVVPMLLQNLQEMRKELPWPTRVLKFLSDFLLDYGWGLLGGITLLVVLLIWWVRTDFGGSILARLMLKLPVFGKLIGRQELGRFALIIASLLRSGMELVEALAVAERSCRNRVLRLAIVQVRRDIEVGMGLKEAFQKHAVFPGTIAHIFSVGQQSGQMEPMLERLAKDYDRQAATLASRVTTVTEPVLIIVLALIVGFIMFATILPILEAGNVLME